MALWNVMIVLGETEIHSRHEEQEDMHQGIVNNQDNYSRGVRIAFVWTGTYVCCALAIIYFYDMFGAAPDYLLGTYSRQIVVVLRTALVATLLSSWAIWFGTNQKHSVVVSMLQTGFATLITLALYGTVGFGGFLGGRLWRLSGDLIYAKALFTETNFLTFIFEIAPATSLAASLLLYLSFVCFPVNSKTQS